MPHLQDIFLEMEWGSQSGDRNIAYHNISDILQAGHNSLRLMCCVNYIPCPCKIMACYCLGPCKEYLDLCKKDPMTRRYPGARAFVESI